MILFSKSKLKTDKKVPILLVSVLVIAICGILYELLISTISSYFQGSSIFHFSIVIGLFLSFMGLGSYLSRFLHKNLLSWFIRFEILLGILGGSSAFLLYVAYSLTPYFYPVAFLLIALLGTLIGLEIPILTRIIREFETLKDAMADVLSFDYLGSLLASVAFPLVLLPFLGIMRTAFAIGLLNMLVAFLNIYLFRDELKRPMSLMISCGLIMSVLIAGLIYSFQITGVFEQFLYRDPILLTRQTPYQRIIITQHNQDTRLFIDGNIQFSSRDEYRYHEPLVHIPLGLALSREHILVLGGGEGLAVREILKHADVQKVTVVDLDPEITELGTSHPLFTRINQHALNDKRVSIYNQDAYKFIEESSDIYDVVIIDLPDPNNTNLGKLYSQEFYSLLKSRISVGGALVTQSTSPYFARQAFWCIHHTLKSIFPTTIAYTSQVPSFGQWGFNVSVQSRGRLKTGITDSVSLHTQTINVLSDYLFEEPAISDLRWLHEASLPSLFQFGKDISEVEAEINRIENQRLVQYYEASWHQWE